MEPNVNPVERAFQLAKTGKYACVADLRLRLKNEGYDWAQIEGRSLTRQLLEAIRAARSLSLTSKLVNKHDPS